LLAGYRDRHLTAITRFDARERCALFLLDLHDRLRRRDLIARPTFNLPLTQEQIADHLGMTMVHVNRTLRHLREDRLAIVAQQVVMLTDLDRLRALVSGMPSLAETPDGLSDPDGATAAKGRVKVTGLKTPEASSAPNQPR
jgi:hypothetical protein